jgi:hypothetical protein
MTKKAEKTLAAVCGLYCGACSLYIATTEDPARLTKLAAMFGVSEEAVKCYGCRSDKTSPHCEKCKMAACATGQGIEFCVECKVYPCDELKKFQAERPHRIELWDDLKRIKLVGYQEWIRTIKKHYACHQCGTVNSAYDLVCRKCGNDPSCEYVEKHREVIERHLAKK